MNRFSIVFLICCFLNSCSNLHDKRGEDDVLNCIHSKARDYSGNTIDIFVLLSEVERVLELNGLLIADRKESYLELFKKLKEGDEDFMHKLQIVTSKVDKAYLLTVPSNFTSIFYCYEDQLGSLKKSESGSLLYNQYEIMKRIYESGKVDTVDFEDIVTLLDHRNFSKELYRLPLVLFIYAEMEAYQQLNTKT